MMGAASNALAGLIAFGERIFAEGGKEPPLAFWGLLVMIALFAALFGLKLFLQHARQHRAEREQRKARLRE